MVRRRRLIPTAVLMAVLLGSTALADEPVAPAAPDSPPSQEAPPADAPAPPPAPAEAPKEPPKDVAQPPKNLVPIPKEEAITVLGKKVQGPAGEDMGRVVDLLFDRDAHIKSIVIDFGGFLGVGSRKIAIDWQLVHFQPDNKDAPVALSLGKAEVQAAPEYKDTAQPPVMVGPPPPPAPPPPTPPPPPAPPPPDPAPASPTAAAPPTPPASAPDAAAQ